MKNIDKNTQVPQSLKTAVISSTVIKNNSFAYRYILTEVLSYLGDEKEWKEAEEYLGFMIKKVLEETE
jgi:hypothetical protein